MTRKSPDHLRVVSSVQSEPNTLESAIGLNCNKLLQAFADVTGWQLLLLNPSHSPFQHQAVWEAPLPDPFTGNDNLLVLTEAPERCAVLTSRKRAIQLAEQTTSLLQDVFRLQHTLVQREAELATAIPVVSRTADEPVKLAARLQSILAGGAQAVSCEAAAVYLLDDVTSQLKLRACWGLPADRFLDPARPLRQAKADVEALSGHLVVLAEASDLAAWNVPEEFTAAICVPISSPTVPLGTMWIYGHRKRTFSPVETNVIEIVGGRIACELEREVLLSQMAHDQNASGLESMIEWQANRRSLVAPVLNNWQVSARPATKDRIGNDSYGWKVQESPFQLMLSICRAYEPGVYGAMTTNFVDGLIQGHFLGRHSPPRCHASQLDVINSALWESSAGDQTASVGIGSIEMESGQLHLATAGQIEVLIIRPEIWESGSTSSALAGVDGQMAHQIFQSKIDIGDILLMMAPQTDSRPDNLEAKNARCAELADSLRTHQDLDAEELVNALHSQPPEACRQLFENSTIVIAKHTA